MIYENNCISVVHANSQLKRTWICEIVNLNNTWKKELFFPSGSNFCSISISLFNNIMDIKSVHCNKYSPEGH